MAAQEETQQFTAGGSLGGQVCVCVGGGGVTPDIQGPRIRKTCRDYRGGGGGGGGSSIGKPNWELVKSVWQSCMYMYRCTYTFLY